MSALGQKQTLKHRSRMSALPPKADMPPVHIRVRVSLTSGCMRFATSSTAKVGLPPLQASYSR